MEYKDAVLSDGVNYRKGVYCFSEAGKVHKRLAESLLNNVVVRGKLEF
jgi:hypothetical protein